MENNSYDFFSDHSFEKMGYITNFLLEYFYIYIQIHLCWKQRGIQEADCRVWRKYNGHGTGRYSINP